MVEPRYSIVIPVYKNSESLQRLFVELTVVSEHLGYDVEVIFVVDGSPDTSLEILLAELPRVPFFATVFELSRNFGSFPAIRAGMANARGDFIAVMSADLQEPPELVEQFFDLLKGGRADIVLGSRAQRTDSKVTTTASTLYWWAYRRTIHREIPRGGVDVFGCTREVATAINDLSESNTSLIGLLYWIGYRKVEIPYTRLARQEGKSSWTFGRKLQYVTDSIYAFTGFPIVALQIIGLLGTLMSVALGFIVAIGWLTGRITETGYTPIMLVITGSTSAILFALGIVGSYVWRTYENSKNRPSAIVRRAYVADNGREDCE